MKKQKAYQYVFPAFSDQKEILEVFDKGNDNKYQIEVGISDLEFRNTQAGIVPSLLMDLVDLSIAIYLSDWILPKSLYNKSEINVQLPLRNAEIFNRPGVKDCLHELLSWYTFDDWSFSFVNRTQAPRAIECKPKLPFPTTQTEVALWSGGLDSLAGAKDRISAQTAERYAFFGTGINRQVLGKQEEIFHKLKSTTSKEVNLIRVPIKVEYDSKCRPSNNSTFRARGITFKILGAICALLEGQNKLYIYENGYGALNLPFTKAETGIMHTRSVHPISLSKLSGFISTLLDKPFTFENPYIFHTKAQMCKSLESCLDIAWATVSCDGRYRHADTPSQCGHCSSCLLRRLALLHVFGQDKTDYVVNHINVASDNHRNHFPDMDFQVKQLLRGFQKGDAWSRIIDRHSHLESTAFEMAKSGNLPLGHIHTQITELLQTHCKEWEQSRSILEN